MILFIYKTVKWNYALEGSFLFLKPNLSQWRATLRNREMKLSLRNSLRWQAWERKGRSPQRWQAKKCYTFRPDQWDSHRPKSAIDMYILRLWQCKRSFNNLCTSRLCVRQSSRNHVFLEKKRKNTVRRLFLRQQRLPNQARNEFLKKKNKNMKWIPKVQ